MGELVKLSNLFRIGSSKRVLKAQWQKEGVPFYRGREITRLAKYGSVDNELFISEALYIEYSQKHGAPKSGDIVITAIGTIGNSYIVKDKDKFYFKDASVLWLKKTSGVSSEYINIWLKSSLMREQLDEGNGATVDTLTIKKLQNLIVDLPSISEQKRIVAILDQAFSDIEKARANAEQNLKNTRELFESYLQQVFSQRGDGWIDKTMSEIALLSRGHNPPKSEFIYEPKKGYIRFFQIRDGKSDKYAVYVPESEKLHRVNKEDILMVAYRHVGGAFRGVKGAFNVALCKIVNRDKAVILDDYLFNIIPSDFVKGELLKASERSLIPSMSVKHLASLKIPIPPIKEQIIIVDKINCLHEMTQKLENNYQIKLTALDELKKSILQKAFTGKLTKKVTT